MTTAVTKEGIALPDAWNPDINPDSLQATWPEVEAPIDEHLRHAARAVDYLATELVSHDNRWQLAYTYLLTGRPINPAFVEAVGDRGVGKTTFGDMLFGEASRAELSHFDDAPELWGHPRVTDHSYVPGKLRSISVPGNPHLWLNEGGHLSDASSMHRVYDQTSIEYNGRETNTKGLVIYEARNPADGRRNSESDAAWSGRKGQQVYQGDLPKKKASELQGTAAANERDMGPVPIMPVADRRIRMHEFVVETYKSDDPRYAKLRGDFVVELIDELNRSGLVSLASDSDTRIGEHLLDSARADLLLDRLIARGTGEEPNELLVQTPVVIPENFARVAAQVLTTTYNISRNGRAMLKAELGRVPTNLEQAVFLRRLIARTSFGLLVNGQFMDLDSIKDGNPEDFVTRQTASYTYANTGKVDLDLDKLIADNTRSLDKQSQGAARPQVRGKATDGDKDKKGYWYDPAEAWIGEKFSRVFSRRQSS